MLIRRRPARTAVVPVEQAGQPSSLRLPGRLRSRRSAALVPLAYDTHSDKLRAALIGAATALSAGIAGVMSALITSWRANILEERRALRTLRRDAAARALVGMADMERYANEWRRAKEIKEGLEPGAHAALKAAVETEVQVQRQLRSGAYGATVQALAALRLVSSPKVRAIVDSVRDEAQALEKRLRTPTSQSCIRSPTR